MTYQELKTAVDKHVSEEYRAEIFNWLESYASDIPNGWNDIKDADQLVKGFISNHGKTVGECLVKLKWYGLLN